MIGVRPEFAQEKINEINRCVTSLVTYTPVWGSYECITRALTETDTLDVLQANLLAIPFPVMLSSSAVGSALAASLMTLVHSL